MLALKRALANRRSIGVEALAIHYMASQEFRSISNVARISAGGAMQRVRNVLLNLSYIQSRCRF
jgi:hypothetical protein